jgi:D-glycero-D-manno-heptose 1,7-bisphosphate phosphatase
VVATNQSGISRGLLDMVALNAINDRMCKAANQTGGRIDAMFFCPHASTDNCSCRKPSTGMFKEISDRFGLELNGVPAIGDSLRDLQAAAAVGADPVLVLTGKGKKTAAAGGMPANTKIFANLAAAVNALTQ